MKFILSNQVMVVAAEAVVVEMEAAVVVAVIVINPADIKAINAKVEIINEVIHRDQHSIYGNHPCIRWDNKNDVTCFCF